MYFGALAVGADLAGGIHAFYFADQLKKNISFSFKGMKADFIKRAETDVIFECKDGLKVKAALEESARTNERVNEVTKVQAFNLQDELVAEFEMQLSVRCK